MSSQKYASPLYIELKSSVILLSVLMFLHAGAIVCVLFLELPLSAKLIIVIAVVINVTVTACSEGMLSDLSLFKPLLPVLSGRLSFEKLVWDADDRWKLFKADGECCEARLLAGAFVHRRLTVLNFVVAKMPWYRRRKALVLLPDNVEETTFRHLRVRLRWYANVASQDNSAVLK
ncbi:MAG: hypothetical protein GXP08_14155 [Gammaproteobacteria bacterium]|nr:hypothetical protein [Gammaproteobacteria bacterium]